MAVRKGVVGIVFRKKNDDTEFLLLHRQKNWKGWEFSKGGIEKGENDEEALLREVEEETGLKDVKVRSKIPHIIEYKYGKHLRNNDSARQSVFLVESFSDKVNLSEEHDNYGWMSYRDALKTLKHENQKKVLSKSMEFLL
jgi:8-oxo-dGTP pyrophosphatase MutT (NUDIX family)